MKTNISCSIDADLAKWLQKQKDIYGVSRSVLINKLLTQYKNRSEKKGKKK